MFTKIDKKVLLILVVTLVVILLVGFMVYKYIASEYPSGQVKVQNSIGGAQTEKNSDISTPTPQVQIQAGGIQAQSDNGAGVLSVCLDKCGDGVCLKTDPDCGKNNNLNCICPETEQECPQDCK